MRPSTLVEPMFCLYVGVETEVQTGEVCTLASGIALGVAQRERIHADIVATFHINLIVLRRSSAVHILLPVGVVVEHLAIVVRRALVEESKLAEAAC